MSEFRTAPMKDGIRYNSKGEPMPADESRRVTREQIEREAMVEALQGSIPPKAPFDAADVLAVVEDAGYKILPASSPAGIDRERLAEVLHGLQQPGVGWPSGPGRQGARTYWPSRTVGSREFADLVAAEYERLSLE